MKSIIQDKYILGQSETKTIQEVGEEIRLDLVLQPAAGRVNTGQVTGTIKDKDGKVITEGLVKLMSTTYEPLFHAVSDANGIYSFSNLPVNTTYTIFATASGKLLKEGERFNVGPYEVVTKDFELDDDASAQLGIIAGDLFNGVTLAAVGGAVITLYKKEEGKPDEAIAITYTNEYGQYTFRDLQQGAYTIRISALGYEAITSTITITQPGQIAPVIVHIAPNPFTSRGTVSGMIVDSYNQPIASADVILYIVNADKSLTPVAVTKTNISGVYLFTNISSGSYKVKSNQTEVTNIEIQ